MKSYGKTADTSRFLIGTSSSAWQIEGCAGKKKDRRAGQNFL
ncbi:MAG: hypothetical protein ACLVI9_00940 [Anaerostipes hadrus]